MSARLILVHCAPVGDTHLREDVARKMGIRAGDKVTDEQVHAAIMESARLRTAERKARSE